MWKTPNARNGQRSHALRRWRVGLAALVPAGALLASLVIVAPASADIPPETSRIQTIQGYAGMCLDVVGDLVQNYQPVDLYTCNNTEAQAWVFVPAHGNYGPSIRLAQNLNMCLDVYQGSTAWGTLVDIYPCLPNDAAQEWTQEPGGALYNLGAALCLDDPAFSTTPGTWLETWYCNAGDNQKWKAVLLS